MIRMVIVVEIVVIEIEEEEEEEEEEIVVLLGVPLNQVIQYHVRWYLSLSRSFVTLLNYSWFRRQV